jgi:parvulin-like peptidyl-prolyl isomerase
MTSAKAWYWLGLGILALSFMTSGAGRSAMDHAAAYATCIRTRALPYVGAIELALGRTQAGYGHLQASMEQSRAQMLQARAQMEAQQARIEAAQRVMMEAHIQQQLRRAQRVMVNRSVIDAAALTDEVVDSNQVVMPNVEVLSAGRRVIVCPRTKVRMAAPAVHVSVAPVQEPI